MKNKKNFNFIFILMFVPMIIVTGSIVFLSPRKDPEVQSSFDTITPLRTPSPTPAISPLPLIHIIPQRLHVFQTFNNCGPATLSMALSYVGQNVSQKELGQQLRPYQVPGGDNDDKSVTLTEVAQEAERRGFIAYLRPNGTMERLKQFIAENIVVITRTWLKADEDIGHYRIVRGYDDRTREVVQDDSLQGSNRRYSYENFLPLWKTFNYEYLVIVPEEKRQSVELILGNDLDEQQAWNHARIRIEKEIALEPDNWQLVFALSRIYYYLGNYERSVELFNEIESKISFRTLWYQIEPILAMYESKHYARVFQLTEKILNNHNRAFSELYLIRGQMYKHQRRIEEARSEYKKAVQYNISNSVFREALQLVTN